MLVVFEPIERCTGGGQENNVAGRCLGARGIHGFLHRASTDDFLAARKGGRHFFGRFPDRHDRLDMAVNQPVQPRIIIPLVAPSEQQYDRLLKGLKRIPDRVDIRRLRIVDIADAAEFAHELETVLDPLEILQRCAQGWDAHPGDLPCERCRHRIVEIMDARDADLVRRHDGRPFSAKDRDQLSVLREGALIERFADAERHQTCPDV